MIRQWFGNGLRYSFPRGEVDDRADSLVRQCSANCIPVANVAGDDRKGPSRDCLKPIDHSRQAVAEIVEQYRFVTGRQQGQRRMRPDISSAAGKKDTHFSSCPLSAR